MHSIKLITFIHKKRITWIVNTYEAPTEMYIAHNKLTSMFVILEYRQMTANQNVLQSFLQFEDRQTQYFEAP